ncbi:MAG: quinoprotein dehydrogenase-associated SoxYZ-like carrier [Acetobacteraceae bacterium]|nr:quinoprotein dehydrogenase-associated SoxYZ-like carrier [Acetobacteraceae bacterium]
MRAKYVLTRRHALASAIALGTAGATANRVRAQAPAEPDPWPSLAAQIFNRRPIEAGSHRLDIDAPYRAEDAAVVPLTVRLLGDPGGENPVRRITLVIDRNPSPLAASFTLGAKGAIRSLSSRVRVDSYTNIHAVAETADGRLHAAERFVKAAGGCSAPAAKVDADAIPLGTMRLRQFSPARGSDRREAALMIRHPNYSGMQMDQVTRLYVPAFFVASVEIWQGDDPLLAIESGISISENPEFRFDFQPNGADAFRAVVKDSQGHTFEKTWPAAPA